MFSGIVEAVGAVVSIDEHPQRRRVTLRAPRRIVATLRPGDSLAVNGVCLTALQCRPLVGVCAVEVTEMALAKSTAREWRPSTAVNIERAAPVGARNSGHIVQGHVSGVGTVTGSARTADNLTLSLELPASLLPYVVAEGSIAVEGVSLTVASVRVQCITVSIIPYTAAHTTLGGVQRGDTLNIETDIIARQVAETVRRYLEATPHLHQQFHRHSHNTATDTAVVESTNG